MIWLIVAISIDCSFCPPTNSFTYNPMLDDHEYEIWTSYNPEESPVSYWDGGNLKSILIPLDDRPTEDTND